MSAQLNNLSFYVNGQQIPYEPDSLSWTEGFGTYNIRNVVVGGSQTEQVFSEDIKSKFSTVKVSLPSTIEASSYIRTWKNNLNNNVVEIIGTVDGQDISRIFTKAAIQDDPEIKVATEGTLEIEWRSNPAQ